MVAALGTGGTTFKDRLFSGQVPRLPLKALPAFGKTVTLGWETPAGALLVRVSRTADGVVIEAGGTSVRVGMREWPMPAGRGTREKFTCPRCDASRDVLHWAGEWGCRGKDCLDLEYASRHRWRWCPAVRRRAALLRKLVKVPRRSLRGRWLRAQIARQQAAMVANLKRANRDLTKRSRRHGGCGRPGGFK